MLLCEKFTRTLRSVERFGLAASPHEGLSA